MNTLKNCLVGEKYKDVIGELRELGFNTVLLPENKQLDEEVNNHADILTFRYNSDLFICSDIAGELINNFTGYTVQAVQGIRSPYPFDCKLNVAVLGDKLVCNTRSVAPQLATFAESNNLKIVHTNQGYTKCSLCIVSDNAVITEDSQLSSLLKNYQINVLEITKGHVSLSDKHYGFIGGAGVLLSKTKMYFNGDITKHPDYNKIIQFLSNYGVEPVFNKNRPLTDFGGFVLI